MRTTRNAPPQPLTVALRIGGAAALAFVALLSISALVGAPPANQDLMLSQSGAALPSDMF